VQVCDACDYRWIPCSNQHCRGYRLHLEGTVPRITGCPECDAANGGVKTEIVHWWPEAWRAVARRLDDREDREEPRPSTAVPKLSQ
jgi:hypothetical protein